MINKASLFLTLTSIVTLASHAYASEIATNTALMQAMDKITGRVSMINVPVNSEVKFGSFSILVRDCKTRSPEETPENFAFVDIVDTNTNSQQVNIFKGWMLSSSPALNAIEHPVYDVWLLKCIDTDISQAKIMSEDELRLRDNIPQQLIVKTSAPQINDSAFSHNLSGEPINLLPQTIIDAGEQKIAEEELFPLQSIEQKQIEDQTSESSYSVPAKEDAHSPKSLLNIDNINNIQTQNSETENQPSSDKIFDKNMDENNIKSSTVSSENSFHDLSKTPSSDKNNLSEQENPNRSDIENSFPHKISDDLLQELNEELKQTIIE